MEIKRYKIIAASSPFYGQVGTATLVYYDHQHTGNSPDMVCLLLDSGKQVRYLSTSLEEVADESPAPAEAKEIGPTPELLLQAAQSRARLDEQTIAMLRDEVTQLHGLLAARRGRSKILYARINQLGEERDELIQTLAETRLLLIGLRDYVLHHDIGLGECAAWDTLKLRNGIGLTRELAEREALEWERRLPTTTERLPWDAPRPYCPEHERPMALAGGRHVCLVMDPLGQPCCWTLELAAQIEQEEGEADGAD